MTMNVNGLLFLFCALVGMPLITKAQDCKSIGLYESYRVQSGYIKSPGKYCLTYDIAQPRLFDIHAGSYKSFSGASLISIACGHEQKCSLLSEKDNYQIDLQGHVIKADVENMIGIQNWSGGLRVSIKNGYIDVPGSRSPNYGISLRGERVSMQPLKPESGSTKNVEKRCWPSAPFCEDISFSEYLDKKEPIYNASDYSVEHMTIKAGWRGVVMGGANNILRDSTIEVDGQTAIFMYGPGSIIENNTIIIHGQGDAKSFDAAIKLRDAHGAIVRNNRIIYKGGWFGKAPAAVNLLDSTDVKIEGNTIEKFEKLVRLNGESTFSEAANSLK
jgi:Right handed beta helix region